VSFVFELQVRMVVSTI